MSITKSFNRHTNTWYAYETSYVWDETKQKKVQKRRCVGKVDPATGQIVETGRRGRPRLTPEELTARLSAPTPELDTVLERLSAVERQIADLKSGMGTIAEALRRLSGETLRSRERP